MINETIIKQRNFHRSLKEFMIVTIFFILSCCILFYFQIYTKFNILTGNRFDGIIETSLLEHWYNFFRGFSDWITPGYFYPYTDTLGYNDGYFLYGVIFSFYRYIGIDIFLSSEIVNITIKAIGFYSICFLLKSCFKVSLFYAILGAIIFTLANSIAIQARHVQIYSVAFAPLLSIFLNKYLYYFCNDLHKKKTIFFGSLFGFSLSLWMITTFYMAWFYSFFLIIFFSILIVIGLINKIDYKKIFSTFDYAKILIPLFITIISLIPFLYVYLPKLSETGGHSFSELTGHIPSALNLLYPGSDNLLFGRLSDFIFGKYFVHVDITNELRIGFPPIILILSILSLFYFWKKKETFTFESLALKSLSLSLFVSFFLMTKTENFIPWKIIWEFVPGAKGMRVVARYALFLIFPISILSTVYLAKINKNRVNFIVVIIGSLLILEQVNLSRSQFLDRTEQLNFIKNIGTPPSTCKVFFVSKQRKDIYPHATNDTLENLYPHNVDSMLISEYFALRTINGFATFNPPDWNFSILPLETYPTRIQDYIAKHKITNGMCELDLNKLKWINHDQY